MKTNVALALFFFFNLFACTRGHDESGSSETNLQAVRSYPLNTDEGYTINPITHDSIKPILNSSGNIVVTGKPIPAVARKINPDSIQSPGIIPAVKSTRLIEGNITKINTDDLNVFNVEQNPPQVIRPGEGNSSFILKNSIGTILPTGKPVKVHSKIVPCQQPQPIEALPLRMKDVATKNFQYLDVDQGLNSSYLLSMMEDRQGNIWFGTWEGGVTRYDGASFLHYTTANGLPDNTIHAIMQDIKGNIWFGTRGGISRYDGSVFENFTEADGLCNNIIRCMKEDSKHNLWFGTAGGGAIRFDGELFTFFTTRDGLINNKVRSIAEDKEGRIWFGCNEGSLKDEGGASSYDGTSFTNYTKLNGLSHNAIMSMIADRHGNLWFGTEGGGVSMFDGNQFMHYNAKASLKSDLIWSILEDHKGTIWFGTENNGVAHLTEKGMVAYTERDGLNHSFISCILEDQSGNYWFGSYGGGVSRFDATSFTHISTKEGLLDKRVWSIGENKKGDLLFGSNGSGVSIYDKTSFTHYIVPDDLFNNTTAIAEDSSGNVWLGTWEKGVFRFNGTNSFSHYTRSEGLSGDKIKNILLDDLSNLWFATESGVTKFDGKEFYHFTDKEGLSENAVWDIAKDRHGNFWFATAGGGVTKYDGTHFIHYTEKEGLSSNKVHCIYESNNGLLWFGSDGGGVSSFDGKQFTYYTEENGLCANKVYSIMEDDHANLWVSTEKGLSYFSFNHDTTAGKTNQDVLHPTIICLGSRDGLQALDFLTNSALIDHDNQAWWGGGKSLVTIDLNTFAPSTEKPKLYLRNVVVNETFRSYSADTKEQMSGMHFDSVQPFENYPLNPALSHRQNHLHFNFSAIDWSSPHQLKYRYQLKGLSDDWSIPDKEAHADYRGLPPGDYIFTTEAIGIAQKWSEPLHYHFTIRPPWWSTWWAYLIYALLFVLAMIGIVRYRSRHLKSQNLILEKKVSVRTTQLRQSIDDLKAAQAQLIQSEKMASLGQLTAGIAHEIQNPLNFINNFSEVNSELIEELKIKIDESKYNDVKTIADQIDSNEQKINHHGKRADAIVKGMLQHSRKSTGTLEPTNINTLADEYLRLAYHGLRAKDKTFEATIKTDFDDSIGMIKIVPQDIGRVLLNLITNAFYAVTEKSKQTSTDYKPTVEVSTRKVDGQVMIIVRDNGSGIPQGLVDKIFQPFFTTKPTGQGTGLGLSICYDIIKAHGGELKVETKEGEGSEFIMQLLM